MTHASGWPLRRCQPGRVPLALCSLALVLVACGTRDRATDTTTIDSTGSATAVPSATSMPDSSRMGNMSGMANMTGDPDRDFLRMMSDHHKGLIAMAHQAKERSNIGTASSDATKLDTKQDAELDTMVTMLEQDYKDPYAPKIIPDNQAMLDSLTPKQGKAYERTFYENVIKHHREAVAMIDNYLPKAKKPSVKQMAERMRAEQMREIDELQRKLAALGR